MVDSSTDRRAGNNFRVERDHIRRLDDQNVADFDFFELQFPFAAAVFALDGAVFGVRSTSACKADLLD